MPRCLALRWLGAGLPRVAAVSAVAPPPPTMTHAGASLSGAALGLCAAGGHAQACQESLTQCAACPWSPWCVVARWQISRAALCTARHAMLDGIARCIASAPSAASTSAACIELYASGARACVLTRQAVARHFTSSMRAWHHARAYRPCRGADRRMRARTAQDAPKNGVPTSPLAPLRARCRRSRRRRRRVHVILVAMLPLAVAAAPRRA